MHLYNERPGFRIIICHLECSVEISKAVNVDATSAKRLDQHVILPIGNIIKTTVMDNAFSGKTAVVEHESNRSLATACKY